MLTTIKTKINKTKQFVQKHQTSIACTATAVATAYMVRTHDVRLVKEFAYDAGYKAGEHQSRLIDAYSFISTKDLWEEFTDLYGHDKF